MFKKLRFLPISIMALVLAVIAFAPAGTTEAGNKIADGVYLGSQDLSGKTMNEAADLMEQYYEKIAASDLTIYVRKLPSDALKKLEAGENVDMSKYDVYKTVKVPVSTFDFDYSIEEALRVASTLGQTGKLVERYKTLMDMKYGRAQLPLSYSVDGEKVKEYVEKVFAPANTKDPVDAKFSWGKDGLQVRQKDQDGIKVYTNLAVNAILDAFENGISDNMTCSAAVGAVPASVTTDSLTNIKFSKVATYTTRFWRGDESSANRSHNIDLAAKYVNGTMVNPGQRVSLNQLIGRRTPERGFKVAHAFVAGKVVDDYGGGVCQFATTFYQCLLQTEMEINVRYNHSLAVTYVGYSQDATLDWGYCDLIFTNNWKNPIYIECSTTSNTVTVSFYGVDERQKGRTVEYKTVVDEEVKTLYPAIELEEDTAPASPTRSGETLSAVKSHLEKIVRVNGVVTSTTKMNNDYYRALRPFVHVGCKGLTLKVVRENDIDQIMDQNGNYLLLNSKYEPIYNGRGGYYLAKDYKHDANNVAVYSGGKLVPVSSGSSHTHSYGSWKSNSNGTHTGTCSCGDKKTENCSFDANGKCTKCGYTKPTTPPSSSETQPPTQPSSSETQPPTQPSTECQHDGATTETVTKQPSCEATGEKTIKCNKCGKVIRTEPIPATGHSWGEGSVTTAPTCTEAGVRTYTCSSCGTSKTETISATGHSWSNWAADNDSTHSRECSKCHAKEQFPHDFESGTECPICHHQQPTTSSGGEGSNP